MSLLELSLIQEPRQEQKLRQLQLQLVRCLIVHYRTDTGPIACMLPVKPNVSTRTAKKAGYEYFLCGDHARLHNDTVAAQVASHAMGVPAIPKELEGIVQLWSFQLDFAH